MSMSIVKPGAREGAAGAARAGAGRDGANAPSKRALGTGLAARRATSSTSTGWLVGGGSCRRGFVCFVYH